MYKLPTPPWGRYREETIGTLVEGKSYKMAGMMVRSFGPEDKQKTYLSTGKQGSTIDVVEDIGGGRRS